MFNARFAKWNPWRPHGSQSRRARQLQWDISSSAGILVALAVLPLLFLRTPSGLPYWAGIGVTAFFYAIVAVGWNLQAGYTGQFSLAPMTFAMIGAYVSTLVTNALGTSTLGFGAAVFATGAVGWGLGLVLSRLGDHYLALATLAFAEIMRRIITNEYWLTRGELGLAAPPLAPGISRLEYYYLFLAAVAFVVVGSYFLLRSRYGLYFQAIREDPIGAGTRGVPVTRWKAIAFAIGSSLAGVAGAMYVHFVGLATPQMGALFQTTFIIVIVMVGGMRTITGPLIGAVIITFTREVLQDYPQYHMAILALMIILIMRFAPRGLMGLLLASVGRRSTKIDARTAEEAST